MAKKKSPDAEAVATTPPFPDMNNLNPATAAPAAGGAPGPGRKLCVCERKCTVGGVLYRPGDEAWFPKVPPHFSEAGGEAAESAK